MVAKWKRDLFKEIRKSWARRDFLTFIHTPKCGGTSVQMFLGFRGSLIKPTPGFHQNNCIRDKGVAQASPHRQDGITFTVIREPVERFESLLNYVLSDTVSSAYSPKPLIPEWEKWRASITSLDEIVESISPRQMLTSFKPFRSLSYWTKNVDVILVMDEVIPFLEALGFKVNTKIRQVNVSTKARGTLNEKSKAKIRQIFHEDVKLYEHWTRKDHEEAG